MPVLITRNSVLDEEDITKNKNIKISFNDTKIKYIDISLNRKIYSNKLLDITIIEINPKEDNIHHFLEINEENDIASQNLENYQFTFFIIQNQINLMHHMEK